MLTHTLADPRRDKIIDTIEDEDERLAVDLMYRAITAPLMQARPRVSLTPCRSSRSRVCGPRDVFAPNLLLTPASC